MRLIFGRFIAQQIHDHRLNGDLVEADGHTDAVFHFPAQLARLEDDGQLAGAQDKGLVVFREFHIGPGTDILFGQIGILFGQPFRHDAGQFLQFAFAHQTVRQGKEFIVQRVIVEALIVAEPLGQGRGLLIAFKDQTDKVFALEGWGKIQRHGRLAVLREGFGIAAGQHHIREVVHLGFHIRVDLLIQRDELLRRVFGIVRLDGVAGDRFLSQSVHAVLLHRADQIRSLDLHLIFPRSPARHGCLRSRLASCHAKQKSQTY